MLDNLLEELKIFLDFTWSDEKRTTRIVNSMRSSIQYLNDLAGTKINFEEDYLAKELLFNRVLYMESQALDDFQTNYNGLMEELRIKYVKDEV